MWKKWSNIREKSSNILRKSPTHIFHKTTALKVLNLIPAKFNTFKVYENEFQQISADHLWGWNPVLWDPPLPNPACEHPLKELVEHCLN